jgi:predicted N-acetyltransferase YhbS
MQLTAGREGRAGREQQIIDLCAATFTHSESAEEGERIGRLVRNLLGTTPEDDVFVCCAQEGPALLGCTVFSRLSYDQDDRTVFILAPVAVRTDRQGRGIGQQLLTYGLEQARNRGVDYAIVYGDPSYYSKVGFRQITEAFAEPPVTLTYPHGWMGQPLTAGVASPIVGPCRCVPALNSPEYW